jgi:putative ABC transport system ATP-binding protein
MIQVRDLQFAYGQGSFHLQVDKLSIAAGERVAWIGPSGSGKTTLLHLVAGIVRPSVGHVRSCGVELTSLPDAARRDFRITNIGLVFQDFALLDYLNVLDNILLPYRINRSLRLDSSVRARAQQLAADVGLVDSLMCRPTHLSQGERQRVAVCRALIATPNLVLADEPTANLDPDNASLVVDALDQHARQRGATLVIVTHDPDMTGRVDRTIDISSFGGQLQATDGGGHNDER